MKHDRLLPFILFICFFLPSTHYADDKELNVLSWTQETLLSTLAISYKTTPNDFALMRKRYTLNAWGALETFFSDKITDVKNKKLVLHPQPFTQPILIEQGVTSGIQYWRVNQIFIIPELNSTLNIVVLVIKGNDPPYLIQSLSMIRN
ncbi:hypothetical protein [Legionella cardiaca]|uniref:Protein IcmL (DotI) n=1 Tax=Legionella cardiaca TaxID=1071983 RepID=A0ABY8AS21_9GAMM|nr:hypothetical protein [Legionella cardiaca]WED42564.1 hypothetical protein PXX05_11680 [Legionella cardiaca]